MYASLVATTRLVIVYLSSVALSSANIQVQQMNTTFITGKAVSTSHTSLQRYSKAQCVKKCLEEGKKGACSVAGYNEATRVCYLSTDSEDDVEDVVDELSGVFVVPQPQLGPECVTEEPLVDGSTPVPDGHMTASSIYYAAVDAPNARLNFAGAWCASAVEMNSSQPNMWIQVQFMDPSIISKIQTQGNAPHTDWVTTFRLEYSVDCVTFDQVLNLAGNGMVFPGNTDDTTIVTNPLPTRVNALCMRLYPLTWNDFPSLRHEYLGCPTV